jgi:hypothetical protein
MSRGRKKLEENIEQPKKWSRLITGEDCDTTWYYDESITTSGPVRVEIKWHKTPKQFEAEVKAEKAQKKEKKRVSKFFEDKKNG